MFEDQFDEQPSLFDPERMAPTPNEVKEEAIARVAATNSEFVEAAFERLVETARTHEYLSSLDVWEACEGLELKGSPRAMGAVFTKANRAGIIEVTQRFEPSGRHSDHNQLLRVWRSKTYTGGIL